MDCEMPVKNGFEASEELIEMMQVGEILDIPIIACTAFTDEERKDACFASGMCAFLTKPVLLRDLKDTLTDLSIL